MWVNNNKQRYVIQKRPFSISIVIINGIKNRFLCGTGNVFGVTWQATATYEPHSRPVCGWGWCVRLVALVWCVCICGAARLNNFRLGERTGKWLSFPFWDSSSKRVQIFRNVKNNPLDWVWCLVSAFSSSWYVLYLLYLFVRFSFGLLSTCVTTGWIFEIGVCANSINQSINDPPRKSKKMRLPIRSVVCRTGG